MLFSSHDKRRHFCRYTENRCPVLTIPPSVTALTFGMLASLHAARKAFNPGINFLREERRHGVRHHLMVAVAVFIQAKGTATCVRTDFSKAMWALRTCCNPADDFDILRNTWSTGLDLNEYPEAGPYASKVLINACKPHRYPKDYPPATLLRRATYDRIIVRRSDLGFSGAPPKFDVFHPE